MVDKRDIKPQELYPVDSAKEVGLIERARDSLNSVGSFIKVPLTPHYMLVFENFFWFIKIRNAYDSARECHQGYKRLDSSPYIGHISRSYFNLKRARVYDPKTTLITLLHDNTERDSVWYFYISYKFGKDIAKAVDALTPPSKEDCPDKTERDLKTFQNISEYAEGEPRVMVARLAERLDNNRSLGHFTEERKEEYAHDTLLYTTWARWHLPELGELSRGGEKAILDYLIIPNERIAHRIIAEAEAKRKVMASKGAGLEEIVQQFPQGAV